MNFRTLFVGVTALMLAILPSLAQDSAAPAETSGFIAITGTKATLANDVLTIEGVSAVLPVVVVSGESSYTYYLTRDLKADWVAAIQLAKGQVTLENVVVDAADTVASGLLTATDASGQKAVDFNITLTLTNPNIDEMTNALTFEVVSREINAVEEGGTPSKSRPGDLSNFVLYINLEPGFLSALGDGSAYVQNAGRPSGAKPCRPAAARRC